jgi:hypothetical protein
MFNKEMAEIDEELAKLKNKVKSSFEEMTKVMKEKDFHGKKPNLLQKQFEQSIFDLKEK